MTESMRAAAIAAMSGLLSLASPHLSAAPVNYDESISGDLVWAYPDWETTVFPLDFGNNRIAGGATYSTALIDEDRFGFIVPEGGRITSIILRYTFPELYTSRTVVLKYGTDVMAENIEYAVVQANAGNGFDTPSPADFFVASLPLMVSGSAWSIAMAGASWQLPGGTLNYEWSLTVLPNAVSEPPALALLGLGFAAMAFTRRRKQ